MSTSVMARTAGTRPTIARCRTGTRSRRRWSGGGRRSCARASRPSPSGPARSRYTGATSLPLRWSRRPVPESPMVSCLMVSRPGRGRLPWLRRSLAGYVGQTHARRELVVVIDETEPETTAAAVQCISALGRDDIRMIRPQRGLSLGALRNLALDEALGEMFCQWDDDDLHHPRRIAVQAAALAASGAEGACLEQAMHFFAAPRHLYGLNFRTCDSGCLPGTILGWRSAPIAYAE